ncbi:MAG: hypothetical protein ACKV2Q_00985 [Planctomycetaceae bacterium]
MTPPESHVTPAIKALFKPQLATQDPDAYAVLLKTWQSFAEGPIRVPKAVWLSTDMTATVGFPEQ